MQCCVREPLFEKSSASRGEGYSAAYAFSFALSEARKQVTAGWLCNGRDNGIYGVQCGLPNKDEISGVSAALPESVQHTIFFGAWLPGPIKGLTV